MIRRLLLALPGGVILLALHDSARENKRQMRLLQELLSKVGDA